MSEYAGARGDSSYHRDRLPEETWDDNRIRNSSFYGAPVVLNPDELSARVAFLGVPFDLGAPAAGARFGPDAIRDAHVAYQYWGSPHGFIKPVEAAGYYSIDTDREHLVGVTMADCGNISIIPGDVERNFWKITRVVRRILDRGCLVVAVGGDHSITPAVVRAFGHIRKLDIVHFDAHLDFTDHYQGNRWTNATPIRRCSEFPWVGEITQIGIRAPNRPRKAIDEARARGNRIITSEQFKRLGGEATIAQVPKSTATYVTLDIDVMDPGIAPGTGATEHGGLSYSDMRAALGALARRCDIVGFDLVEVAPPLDVGRITSKLASQLIIDLLTGIFDATASRGTLEASGEG